MKTLLLSLIAAGALLSLVVLVIRRHRVRRSKAQSLAPPPSDGLAPTKEVLWPRGAEAGAGVVNRSKRAFLHQLALGSVASFAGWMATKGVDAKWAEKLVVATKGPGTARLPKPAVRPERTNHSDHTDECPHTDGHDDTPAGHFDEHDDIAEHDDSHHEDDHNDTTAYGGWSHHVDEIQPGAGPYHTDLHWGAHTDNHADQNEAHTDIEHVDRNDHVDY